MPPAPHGLPPEVLSIAKKASRFDPSKGKTKSLRKSSRTLSSVEAVSPLKRDCVNGRWRFPNSDEVGIEVEEDEDDDDDDDDETDDVGGNELPPRITGESRTITLCSAERVDSRGRAIVDDLLLFGKDISYMSDHYSK